MTPLPKKRISTARQGKRRAAIKMSSVALSKCDNCGSLRIPHQACQNCGMYRGRLVTLPKTKTKVRRIAKTD
ncbi:MAG: 50S ribosomal protein L32 [Candidatus Woykebacteria bacterium RIFCSPHIGHO2_12_FULL_45_10]|uniref:Large ribosomal subunit protein bL32 n=1 Tax=Candidatus Woykebacteria bacterium RIFCSPHIGHO2_12_FULL_45_10 TaxID=1802603 RepID=A0A1G1WPB4_9BACT|nr:MAG: 50S ribosomal protein L32 [Candidatus Woykebacteria bacterium RIFCSPHIGHO2_12_FULL_45_10]